MAKRLRSGERAVAQEDLATALGNRERFRRRRQPLAGEHVAVRAHQQIRCPRRQIGVAPSQPSVAVASGIREALLQRPGSRGRELQAERVHRLPRAREVDDSEDSAGYRVVHGRARARPPMVSLVEVLEGEHLQGVISGEHRPDAVRSGRGFAVPGALDEVHLGGPRSSASPDLRCARAAPRHRLRRSGSRTLCDVS